MRKRDRQERQASALRLLDQLGSEALGRRWIDDTVTSLRVKGTSQRYLLDHDRPSCIVGASAASDLLIVGKAAGVAPKHAAIIPEAVSNSGWSITALGEQPIMRDGFPLRSFALQPGIEIGLGSVQLIAESERVRSLHELLEDVLGADNEFEADHALRAVRRTATDAIPLLLVGDDLPSIALAIHQLAWSPSRFVLCDPRAVYRKLRHIEAVPSALAACSRSGTVCILADHPPPDFDMLARHKDSHTDDARIVLCLRDIDHAALGLFHPLVMRPLAKNSRALTRVVARCIDNVARRRRADPRLVTPEDRSWIASRWQRWSEIEVAAERVIVLYQTGRLSYAANELGLSHVAISRWLTRNRAVLRLPNVPGTTQGRPSIWRLR